MSAALSRADGLLHHASHPAPPWCSGPRPFTADAFAITATDRGQDDALEQFDRLHGELLLRVKAQSQRERFADGEALDEAGRTLMDACRVVLDDAVAEPVRDAAALRVVLDLEIP